MKRRITVLLILIIIAAAAIGLYRFYVVKKTNENVKKLEAHMKIDAFGFDVKEGIKVEKILKRTPSELVMVITWGDKERAYVTIKSWLTKAHDSIEIDTVDKTKRVIMRE